MFQKHAASQLSMNDMIISLTVNRPSDFVAVVVTWEHQRYSRLDVSPDSDTVLPTAAADNHPDNYHDMVACTSSAAPGPSATGDTPVSVEQHPARKSRFLRVPTSLVESQ